MAYGLVQMNTFYLIATNLTKAVVEGHARVHYSHVVNEFLTGNQSPGVFFLLLRQSMFLQQSINLIASP